MSVELTALTDLLEAVPEELSSALTQMVWAEDEICRATNRHPDAGDALYHSFKLLVPTSNKMCTEFVYRGHCRELLDRVARCEDARPGTAAEIAVALCETSLAVPISSIAVGLLFRMWSEASRARRRSTSTGNTATRCMAPISTISKLSSAQSWLFQIVSLGLSVVPGRTTESE